MKTEKFHVSDNYDGLETSADIKKRVQKARDLQNMRFKNI